jgi:hypothetical protein
MMGIETERERERARDVRRASDGKRSSLGLVVVAMRVVEWSGSGVEWSGMGVFA